MKIMTNRAVDPASFRTEPSPVRASSLKPRASRLAGRAWRGRRRHRRGVLLLVVLSILVLFVVIAVTFVLIAGQNRRSLRSESVAERYTNDPQKQCDEAAYQVFRGSDNIQSVLWTHSLLEDMYGANTIDGFLMAAPVTTTADNHTGQLIDLYVSAVNPKTGASQYSQNTTGPYSLISGYYNGQVLTMTSGPARGLSTRIVGYRSGNPNTALPDPTGNSATFRVVAFDGIATSTFIAWYSTGSNSAFDQRLIINGRAFNGTGVGLNTVSPYNAAGGGNNQAYSQLTAMDTSNGLNVPYVYLPNPKYFASNTTFNVAANPFPLLNYSNPVGPGGANEDYDAPDVQNMALAWMPVQTVNPFGGALATIFPSFHRPDLVKWFENTSSQYNTAWTNASTNGIQRKVILRPLGASSDATIVPDHPLFTGSNPNFNPVTGPWDVDNDGDGTMDSVWLDVGFPVQTAADGKTYKPLAAILCLDLDGRVNVNAHGNGAQAFPADNNNDMLSVSQVQGPFSTSNPTAGGLQNVVQLPRGQGYGPAEVNPGVGLTLNGTTGNGIFGAVNTSPVVQPLQSYQQLLYGYNGGTAATEFDGRYGELPLIGNNSYTTPPLPGFTNGVAGAFSNADDVLEAIKHYDVTQNWYAAPLYISTGGATSATLTSYSNFTSYGGAPPDLMGRGAVGLDYRGQPLYCMPATAAGGGNSYLYGPLLQGPGGIPGFESPLTNVNPAVYFDVPHGPYALNLSQRGIRQTTVDPAATGYVDNAFSLAELERILRRPDVDGYTLPDRLRYVLEGGWPGTANQLLHQLITTDSYDVPSPNVAATSDLRSQILANYSKIQNGTVNYPNSWVNMNVADLLAARLVASGSSAFNTSSNFNNAMQAINNQLTMMLPPEVMAGQYMDLNRPFGNGRDDTLNHGSFGGNPLPVGNGANSLGSFVVDEPQEYTTTNNNVEPNNNTVAEAAWNSLFPMTSATVPFNLINGVDYNGDTYLTNGSQVFGNSYSLNLQQPYNNPQLYARQLYARYLYVMMMTLMDQGFKDSSWNTSSITYPFPNELTARRVAQWAVNVVDYRDPDAIMTPFEYDVNPFDGWQVDGLVETMEDTTQNTVAPTSQNERRVVWGCEAPELVLTEAFATHDRRVRDSTFDTTSTSNHYRFDSTGKITEDPTLDQMRIPQGSLFVELYCPRGNSVNANGTGGSQAVYPGELYTYQAPQNGGTAQWYLNLGLMAPAPPGGGNGYAQPVWRLAITSSALQNANNNIQQQFQNNPQASFDPAIDQYNGTVLPATTTTNPISIERLAWFTTTAPNASDGLHQNMTYYNRGTGNNNNGVGSNAPVLMQPGGYAVVGPRAYTNFGRQAYATGTVYPGGTQANPCGLSPQQISLLPNNNLSNNSSVLYTNASGVTAPVYTGAGNIQPPVAIICAAAPPTGGLYAGNGNTPPPAWQQPNQSALLDSNSNTGIGLSVSEPLFSNANYYIEPTITDQGIKNSTFTGNQPGWSPSTYYTSLTDAYGAESATQRYPDNPYECSAFGTTSILTPAQASVTTAAYPLNVEAASTPWKTQTFPTAGPYRYVLLQRLANPLLPFNPAPTQYDSFEGVQNNPALPLNPYITVDWLPIYLTVFNGEALQFNSPNQPNGGGGTIDPDDAAYAVNPAQAPFPPLSFATLQRGPAPNGNITDLNLYSTTSTTYASLPTNTVVNTLGNNVVFDYSLNSNNNVYATLGYLNPQFYGPAGNLQLPWHVGDTPTAPQQYAGDPNPLKWANVRFGGNSSNIMFPWVNWPNRPLVSHYELMQVPATSPTRLYYEVGNSISNASSLSTASVYGNQNQTDFQTPFSYLLNFAQTTATTAPQSPGTAPHFYRLFEYARVPSRFVGTETLLNPNAISAANNPVNPTTAPADHANEQAMFSYLHPPFNKVSRFRDPGKVNVNTIPHFSTDQNPVVWNAAQDTPMPPNTPNAGSTPTAAGPTWSQVALSMQAGTSGAGAWVPGNTPSLFTYPFRSFAGADYSLPGPYLTGTQVNPPRGIDATFMRPDPTTQTAMLFDFPPPQYAAANASTSYFAYNAPDRNSYFRYQNLASMANILTTRSNVYAVWVTVGYFQVQPVSALGLAAGPTQVYPDGYTLCDELGSDTGNITRHRAFYIFDRTIPVGFERGQNHNVDRAILLRRYIE